MATLSSLYLRYPSFQRLVQHSNLVAGGLTLLAILVCFTSMVIPYILITLLLSGYLSALTHHYNGTLRGHCPWRIQTDRIECQVATLQHKIVVITNIMTVLVGLGSTLLISGARIPIELTGAEGSIISDNLYNVGMFKMAVMFLFVCKIHHTKLLQTLATYYLSMVKHITIPDQHNDGKRTYPVLYLDGSRLNSRRYRVTVGVTQIGVTFDPSIAMGYDSLIEYEMTEPDEDHKVFFGNTCGMLDHETCVFRCQAIVLMRSTSPQIGRKY